ncbi:hypothetical protein MLD38_014609 [Melastoma candidum]|uniref:Uncharacterized protein n=1 Tax=Melastoma candidum TaxID=119954 RepID=A0ACB9RCZ1_9MYRT|nr:hypothetical protein MLD38_014609 [Melastoma candidum]
MLHVGTADYIDIARNYHRSFPSPGFQFETKIAGAKLRRDVLTEGNGSSGGSSVGIISMLSGQEEMFAFRRAVSRVI